MAMRALEEDGCPAWAREGPQATSGTGNLLSSWQLMGDETFCFLEICLVKDRLFKEK